MVEAVTIKAVKPSYLTLSISKIYKERFIRNQDIYIEQDERNVLRDPPAGVDFMFEFESNMPVATAMLECDPKLNDLRFKLVPKVLVQLD